MRIAWVDNARAWGGVEVHVAMLARMAAREGHGGCVFCDDGLADRYAKALAGSGVAVLPGPWHRILSPVSVWRLSRALRDFAPDVVHSHLYWSTRIAAPAARMARVPRVVETVHLEEGWRTGVRRILSVCDGLLARALVDRHIAVSGSVERSAIAARGIAPGRIRTIPNAVLPETALPAPRRSGALAFLGRLEHQKGLDVLVAALAALRDRGVAFDLAIGGEGSLRPSLEAAVAAAGLTESVRFVGRVDDRAAFLSDRSILVLPSRYEGFPMVLLEAAWHDQCVVASAVSGIPELVVDGESGLLCPAEDPKALAGALERAMADADLRARCARGLRHAVESEHDPEVFLRRTLEVLS
jgi:glycosyltransferase involved in cell wall biosynthesis